MYSPFVLLILCLAVVAVQGEVKLMKDRKETITFEGEELTIDVDNSLGAIDDLTLCFGSSPEESRQPCPVGFARFTQAIGDNEKVRFTVNRKGQFVDSLYLKTRGNIKFNDDGTLTIMVIQLPDARTTVTLPNAEVFVPEKPEDETTVVEKKSNGATIGIAVGVSALILILIGVVVTVAICLYRRKKNQQPIAPPEIVVQKPEAAKTPNPSPSINKIVPPLPPAAPEPAPKLPQTPVQPTPTPIPKPVEPKPSTPAIQTPAPSAEVAAPLPPSPSTEPVETPKAPPSVETTEQTKDATVDQPVKQESDPKKSLKVEKTQTATVPSPPTPKFSEHPKAKRDAEKSVFKEKPGVPYSETPNPFKKKNYKKADELDRFVLLTESIRCYGMRNGKFNRHDNFILRERFFTRPHRVHVWEKDIFKSTPSKAVDAADALVARIGSELKFFGYRPEDDLTQNPVLWGHMDYEEAEMSKLYWFLIQQRPELFEVKEQDVKSDEVQAMPIAMLYALILNTKLTRKFREELVVELRAATVDVIRLAGKDKLRLTAFPLNYLVLLYTKDPANYVEGRSVHSLGGYIRC